MAHHPHVHWPRDERLTRYSPSRHAEPEQAAQLMNPNNRHPSAPPGAQYNKPQRPLQQRTSTWTRLPVAWSYTWCLRILKSCASSIAELGPANSLQHILQLQPTAAAFSLQRPATAAALLPGSASTTAAPVIHLASSTCELWSRSSALWIAQPPTNSTATTPSYCRPGTSGPERP
jgi:hypothetical protein